MIITAEQIRSLGARRFSDITEEQLQAVARGDAVTQKKRRVRPAYSNALTPESPEVSGIQARGRVGYEPGRMNKTETRYFNYLQMRQKAGEIAEIRFEAFKLRLADRTFYTPDFDVMLADGMLEFHEVKGYMEDDAAIKLKVVAELFQAFRFKLVRWIENDWVITDVL